MQSHTAFRQVLFLSLAWGGTACVTTGQHQLTLDELAKTKQALASTQQELQHEENSAAQDHNALSHELTTTQDALEREKQMRAAEDAKLTDTLTNNTKLAAKLASLGQNVDKLLGEKDALAQERAALKDQLDELRRLRDQSDARSAEYKKLLAKLHNMIDAGTLQVKIRNGRMLVQMSSDLLFPSGGTKLKPDAIKAVTELAETLRTFPDRKFQVVGHSDSTPIKTDRFPSNWELSTERAIEVAKVMVNSGLPATMISAAGNAEFEPIAANDSPEHKALNRRVELVFLPKLDELPGFADALKEAS